VSLLAKQLQIGPYLLWIGVSLVLVVAASVFILWYRTKVLGRDQGTQVGLLDELREMRNRGELSDEEYAAAKHAMVSRVSGNPTPRPVAKATAPSTTERLAPPGFDLTGQPLPKPPQTPDV
jgi:hypothetical protein